MCGSRKVHRVYRKRGARSKIIATSAGSRISAGIILTRGIHVRSIISCWWLDARA
jgi:hypothetical protein